MIYVRTQPPAELAVSLGEFRAHLRLEADDRHEDVLLEAYLKAAIDELDGRQGLLGQCLVEQEWQAFADAPAPMRLGSGFALELGPIRTDLTIAVEYRSAGEWVHVDPDHFSPVQTRFERAIVMPTLGRAWPMADRVPNAWRITFTAGFGEPVHVPAALKAAILLRAADLHENRDGKTPASFVENLTLSALIGPYRVVTL